MANLEARIRTVAGSILENEALRDGLFDEEAAKTLLNWGISRAESLARQTAEIEDDEAADEAMYPRMKALRKMMAAVKDLATAEGWSPESIRQTLETTFSQARILNGETWQPPANIEQAVLLALQPGDSRARMNNLLKLLTQNPAQESPGLGATAPADSTPQQSIGFFQRLFRRIKGD